MKYFKPNSLTWWAGVVPIIGGVVVALASAFPQLASAAALINSLSGNLEPPVMINAGLVAIGMRGAIN